MESLNDVSRVSIGHVVALNDFIEDIINIG